MADKTLDGYLELVPGSTMLSMRSLGESLDSQHGSSQTYGAIHIKSFKFGGDVKTKKTKVAVDPKAGSDGKPIAQAPKVEKKRKARSTDKNEFGFSVTKEFDASSPFLYRAYCSNSYKPKRPQFNAFSDATVSLRKSGASGDQHSDYLVVSFKEVCVTGYTFKVDGPEPPQETVTFKALFCKMEYFPQLEDGTLGKGIARQKDLRTNTTSSS